jgi:MFS family permease
MILILVTAFLDILGIGILIPVLPDIIIHFGVAESWNPYSQGIYSIGMFLGWLVFGRLSDKYGRKNLLSVTTTFNLLGYIILYISLSKWLFTADIWVLFLVFLSARFVSWLGWSGLSVLQAYISDVSSREDRAKNMGMIGAAFGLAFLIGPAIGGVLSQWGIEYVIFGCIAAISINLFLILVLLKEPVKHAKEMHADNTPFHFSKFMIILFILSFWGTLAFSAVQTGSGQYYKDVFGFSSTQIGYTLSLVWLVAIIYQGGLVKYVRKALSEVQMIQVAVALMSLSLFLFAINKNPILLYPIVALFPLAMGTFQPAINSLISAKAGKEVGKIMGYNTSVISIASIAWPFLVGSLYNLSKPLPFYISSFIAFALFLIASFWLKK